MLRLLKILVSLALLAGFAVFGFTVRLGDRTLFGHLQAIWRTKESQDLVRGTEEAARPLIDKLKPGKGKSEPPDAGQARPSPPGAASDSVTDEDRRKLRRVLGAAPGTPPRRETR